MGGTEAEKTSRQRREDDRERGRGRKKTITWGLTMV